MDKGLGKMSRVTPLDSRLWLGLSAGEAQLLRTGKAGEGGYPPYNIELLPADEMGAETLRITLAVAGFKIEDLDISLEQGQLIVRGKQIEDKEREFLHRGIATRQFKRSFTLAHGVEVKKAELNNGLLAIELERPQQGSEARKVCISGA